MEAGRGKRVALLTAAAGLAVLLGAGYALRDRIREEYWLYWLEHGDEQDKLSAAARLVARASIRAVRPILGEYDRGEEHSVHAFVSSHGCLLRLPKKNAWAPLVQGLAHAGPDAAAAVRKRLLERVASVCFRRDATYVSDGHLVVRHVDPFRLEVGSELQVLRCYPLRARPVCTIRVARLRGTTAECRFPDEITKEYAWPKTQHELVLEHPPNSSVVHEPGSPMVSFMWEDAEAPGSPDADAR